MPEPIEGAYFNWLRAKVVDTQNTPPYLYLDLMKILYRTEFVWTRNILGDKNREEDGKELREDFLRETGHPIELGWFDLPCSIFEMLIAFSGRAAFQTDMTVADWFWKFIENLHLDGYMTVSEDDLYMIERILNTWIWRIYDPSGYGGLFPLHEPEQDQRTVELWHQLFLYLNEQELV